MLKVAEREQVKLEAIMVEKKMFDQRCEMREVKRKLGEAEGDEDLLISRREKRRKREDGSIGLVLNSSLFILLSRAELYRFVPPLLQRPSTITTKTRSEQHHSRFPRPIFRRTPSSQISQRKPRQTDRARTATETASRRSLGRLDRFFLPRSTTAYSCSILAISRTDSEFDSVQFGQAGDTRFRYYLASTDRKGAVKFQEEDWTRWKGLPRSNRSDEKRRR